MNKLQTLILTDRQLCEYEGIATGVFNPVDTYMDKAEYDSVLADQELPDGSIWPIPICLDISSAQADALESGAIIELRDKEEVLLAEMVVTDIWEIDKKKEALAVYDTLDHAHPGVKYLFNQVKSHYICGKLSIKSLPRHYDFRQHRFTPEESKSIIAKFGWNRTVGYQTRNPIHRIQYEMTNKALKGPDTGLFVFTAAGVTKPGDFDMYTRVRCLSLMKKNYPPGSFMLGLVPFYKRMAGPREALFQALIARNHGCTHFIVGRDQAGPGNDSNGTPIYKPDAGLKLLNKYQKKIGIKIIPFSEMVYLPFDDEYMSVNEVPEDTQYLSFSGTQIRERIKQGKKIPEWASFKEVIDEIKKAYPAPDKKGFTVFFTGLSGAGKSTLAKILYSYFLERGDRPVTLLDGDIVRKNLSSELNFTKEHRDINVKRIGFVASEITKNRGIAICAPIAPYETTRNRIRSKIEDVGGFFEIHVSTSIDECEKRDRKGMYKKARAGIIKDFTGVDDPYENPVNPELRIDTTNLSPEDAAELVLNVIRGKGFLSET